MTLRDFFRINGPIDPRQSSVGIHDNRENVWLFLWSRVPVGVEVHEPDSRIALRVGCGSGLGRDAFKTASGIGLGAGEGDVARAYGDPAATSLPWPNVRKLLLQAWNSRPPVANPPAPDRSRRKIGRVLGRVTARARAAAPDSPSPLGL